MRVSKNQLTFLKQYVGISDTSSVLGDKLKIKVKRGEIIYSQKSKDALLITKVASDTNEEFELLVQTKMFWDFINTVSDTDELTITEKGIQLGEDKSYTFESFNLDFPDVESIHTNVLALDSEPTTFKFDFKDFDKLSVISKYIGKDSLEAVGFLKGKLLGTDRVQIAYSDASITLPENYFLGKAAVNLIMGQKGNGDLRIAFTKDCYYFVLNEGTLCMFEWKKFAIPDLFDAKIFTKFNQVEKVKVNRAELVSALTRMSFFVFNNPSNRIFITVKKDHILIENRDFNKSFEKVYTLEGESKLEDVTVILNNKNVLSFLANLGESEIDIFINSDSENRASARFEDSVKDFKFVHVLLKEE